MPKSVIMCLTVALCLTSTIYSTRAKELKLEDIFPRDRVIDIQITLSQQDWDTIRHQSRDFMSALDKSRQFEPIPHPYTYVEASVTIDGILFPKVGIRKKGFIGSQNHIRPSLKIKLNHIDKENQIEGLTNLTLNNNQQDTSQVSQFLGYTLFNAIGTPAPRCAYAKVTVNGKNLGIYSHVESMRKPILKRAFGNDNGPLYEGTVVDFYKRWNNSFEHKRGDDTLGREKINTLINTLADDQVTEEAIDQLVDLNSFYRYWATESLLGFWDGYAGNNNNFFVYLNPKTQKFHFLPWGADSLFTKFSKIEFQRDIQAPISVKTQGLIAYRLYQLQTGRKRYAETLTEILKNHWNEIELLAELDRISALIRPHLIPEQRTIREGGWWQNNEKHTFENELEKVRDFIRTRKADILQEIANGMPSWNKRPRPPFVVGAARLDDKTHQQVIQTPEDGLWHAIHTRNLTALKRYIKAGADVNALDDSGNLSPLAWSTFHGNTDVIRILIQNGANVNIKSHDGGTPLHGAAVFGRAEAAKLLLQNGANPQATNNDGATPINALYLDWRTTTFIGNLIGVRTQPKDIERMKTGRKQIAKLLGIQDTFTETNTSTANKLREAISAGNPTATKQALADGANPNQHDPQSGSPPLITATVMGHADIAALLLEHGADVNLTSRDGDTALHAAAFLGHPQIAQLLLQNGADTDIRNKTGSTPTDVAQTNWQLTQVIVGILGLEVDETTVKTGRSEVIKLITTHNKTKK